MHPSNPVTILKEFERSKDDILESRTGGNDFRALPERPVSKFRDVPPYGKPNRLIQNQSVSVHPQIPRTTPDIINGPRLLIELRIHIYIYRIYIYACVPDRRECRPISMMKTRKPRKMLQSGGSFESPDSFDSREIRLISARIRLIAQTEAHHTLRR